MTHRSFELPTNDAPRGPWRRVIYSDVYDQISAPQAPSPVSTVSTNGRIAQRPEVRHIRLATAWPQSKSSALQTRVAEEQFKKLADRALSIGNLARVWIYAPSLTESTYEAESGDGLITTYDCISRGRTRAWHDHPLFRNRPWPAATCVDCLDESNFVLEAVVTPEAILGVENPHQTPAWKYGSCVPGESPLFSRAIFALVTGGLGRFYLSATGAISGEATVHVADPLGQLELVLAHCETLINLCEKTASPNFEVIRPPEDVRAYVREASFGHGIAATLIERWGTAQPLILESGLCRPDLELEIECQLSAKSRCEPGQV